MTNMQVCMQNLNTLTLPKHFRNEALLRNSVTYGLQLYFTWCAFSCKEY